MSSKKCQCGATPLWRRAKGKAGCRAKAAERLECPACGNATEAGTSRERVSREWDEAGWCGQAVTAAPFVPFGPEWERAMLRKNKPQLTRMLKHVCLEKEALRATVRRLQARLNRAELEEVVERLAQRGTLRREAGGSAGAGKAVPA